MKSIQDANGTTWNIRLDVGVIEDIDEVIPNFSTTLAKNQGQLAELLWTDAVSVVKILYVVCAEQVKSRNMTPKQFGRSFDRDAIDRATDALFEEIVCFFLYGPVAQKVRKSLPKMMSEVLSKVDEQI